MKKVTLIIALMGLMAISVSAQIKTPPKTEKQYVLQLNETELQQLFQLMNLAKNLAPYGKQKPEEKVNTIQFIDDYIEKLGGKVKEVTPADTVKKK